MSLISPTSFISESMSHAELLKFAQLSHIAVADHEVDYYARQLSARLAYVTRLQEIAQQGTQVMPTALVTNIMREDLVYPCNSEPLLKQAPDAQEHYFVVPVIIKQK